MVELVGADPSGKGFRQITVTDYLRATRAQEKLRGKGERLVWWWPAARFSTASSRPAPSAANRLRCCCAQARQDSDIRAVVLRIDSPGGSVLASEQIYREVQALKQDGKPVVVSMGDVAASGGYYIAAPADQIIASPNTITGSIGVFASIPDLQPHASPRSASMSMASAPRRCRAPARSIGRCRTTPQAAADHGRPCL